MKVQPVNPLRKAVGGSVSGVKWRYDPTLHADGMEVSPEVGRALVKTGHWTKVQEKPKRTFKPTVTQVLERPQPFEVKEDDGIQS